MQAPDRHARRHRRAHAQSTRPGAGVPKLSGEVQTARHRASATRSRAGLDDPMVSCDRSEPAGRQSVASRPVGGRRPIASRFNHPLAIMSRRCPRCGSLDLRRSSFRSREERQDHILRSPYRCEECGERFWVISRKARNATMWMLALVIASGTIALVMAPLIPVRVPPQQAPSAPSSVGAGAVPSGQG